MNKTSYYGRRPTGPYPYPNNYIHTNYTGYPHSYKKNYFFKNRSNIQLNNNNYFEERKKNYYYNNNFNYFNSFSNFGENHHNSSIFQKNRYRHRYNPYFTEEKKIAEEINNDSVNEEEKEEVLKIRINVADNQCKELVICKGDNINEKIVEFCKENNINEKLFEPLYNKVNQSLIALEKINNMLLNKNDNLILDKIRNLTNNSGDN